MWPTFIDSDYVYDLSKDAQATGCNMKRLNDFSAQHLASHQ